MISFEHMKYFIFFSVLIYFSYEYFEKKKLRDEREEFLTLKTFEVVQKVTLFTVTILSIAYMLYPQMPAWVPLVLIVLSSMYTEIFGKLYLRRKH